MTTLDSLHSAARLDTVLREAPPAPAARQVRPRAAAKARRATVRRAAREFRPDIEGLRAVAVLAVVLYHAGLGVPGGFVGVDVFLVLSGFLITGQLVKVVNGSGIRALPVFYAHRVRRLLPAAALVVVATVVAFRFVGPPLKVREVAFDGLFTTFSALNVRLAAVGTDYQHMGAAASPLQHFWSLAVEEQFYLVWPVVVALCLWAGRRTGRVLLGVVAAGVLVTSALASASLTGTSAPWAYFSVHTRAWELGVGALVALTATRLAGLPRWVAGPVAWFGLAAIVASAFRYSDSTPFPGTAAWVPVAGAAAVVAAGCGPRVGIERLLGEPVMQCLGRVSYSWYLWHWPLLVLAPYAVAAPLRVGGRLVVVWVSLALAIASFVLVEQPTRAIHWPSLRWLGAGLGISGLVAASAVAVTVLGPPTTGSGAAAQLVAASDAGPRATNALATALAAGVDVRAVPSNLTPAPADAAASLPPTSRNGCHAAYTSIGQGTCAYGDTRGSRTVVLFGDSHAEQWLPALDDWGKQQHWRVLSWTKAACPAAHLTVTNPALNRDYTECDTWRAATIHRIGSTKPDVVVVGQSENVASSRVAPATFAAATARTIADLRSAAPKARTVYLQDIPTPGTDLPGCVAIHLNDVRACTFDRANAYRYADRHRALLAVPRAAGVATVDPAGWLCTAARCPAVVGNVLVYRNESHLTVPYSRWLSATFARAVGLEAAPVVTPTGAPSTTPSGRKG